MSNGLRTVLARSLRVAFLFLGGFALGGLLAVGAAHAQTSTPASDESLAVLRDMFMYSSLFLAFCLGYRQGRASV